jgi:putative sigma-54 modulation protein
MHIEYRCRGCSVGEREQALIEDRMERLGKYLGEIERAEVHLERSGNPANELGVACELTAHLPKAVVRAKAYGAEELAAFDKAEAKLRHQLERYKSRLLGRSHPHHREPKAGGEPRRESRIVRTKSFVLDALDPETALERMELLEHPFYLFVNQETSRTSVLYRREDGTYGLIEQAEPVDQ